MKERVTRALGQNCQEVIANEDKLGQGCNEVMANEGAVQEEDQLSSENSVNQLNKWSEQKVIEQDVSSIFRPDVRSIVNETRFSEDVPEKEPVSRHSSLEITVNEEILEDDELFHGFNEPFLDESNDFGTAKSKKSATSKIFAERPAGYPAVGSEEWAKGWAIGSDGNFIHVRTSDFASVTLFYGCTFVIARRSSKRSATFC